MFQAYNYSRYGHVNVYKTCALPIWSARSCLRSRAPADSSLRSWARPASNADTRNDSSTAVSIRLGRSPRISSWIVSFAYWVARLLFPIVIASSCGLSHPVGEAAAPQDTNSEAGEGRRNNTERSTHATPPHLRTHTHQPRPGRLDQLHPTGAARIDQLSDQLLRHRQRWPGGLPHRRAVDQCRIDQAADCQLAHGRGRTHPARHYDDRRGGHGGFPVEAGRAHDTRSARGQSVSVHSWVTRTMPASRCLSPRGRS